MRALFVAIILTASSNAFAEMRCKQAFGETICKDDRTGEEMRCRTAFGEQVCKNSRTGQETRCRMVMNEWVCR